MSQNEIFAQRWDAPQDHDFNPWPDPEAGPIARPYNPDFRDPPNPKSKGRNKREVAIVNMLNRRDYCPTGERVKVRPSDAGSGSGPKAEPTRASWNAFLKSERESNAARRRAAGR